MTASANGTLALVGSGEFLPSIQALDQKLLAHIQGTPRVVVLPTASAPDGPGVPERWAHMGVEHFERLGIQVEPVMLLTREDAENPKIIEQLRAANFVYFSGGKPRYLLETLQHTTAWAAIAQIYQKDGIVAGCSAGAMVMGGAIFDFPTFQRTLPALGLAPGLMVIPHFDEISKARLATLSQAPTHTMVVGVDGSTALVSHAGRWTVYGKGGVTVFEGTQNRRYTEDQEVYLPLLA